MPIVETPVASATIQFTGDVELFERLNRLSIKMRDKGVRRALREAAKPIVSTARALVPSRFGLLRESLGVRTRKYRRSGAIVAIIGARTHDTAAIAKLRNIAAPTNHKAQKAMPAKYAHLVEKGTAPHVKMRRRRTVFEMLFGDSARTVPTAWRWRDHSGQWHSFPGGRHPGAKRQPFLEPAMTRNRRRAMGIMRRTLRQYVDNPGK